MGTVPSGHNENFDLFQVTEDVCLQYDKKDGCSLTAVLLNQQFLQILINNEAKASS